MCCNELNSCGITSNNCSFGVYIYKPSDRSHKASSMGPSPVQVDSLY